MTDDKGGSAVFRMWGKLIQNNKVLKDTVIPLSDYTMTRTQMVFEALDKICYAFDLSKPIWLDANISEFQKHSKTRFKQDHFIETIEFDYLEIQIIEE